MEKISDFAEARPVHYRRIKLQHCVDAKNSTLFSQFCTTNQNLRISYIVLTMLRLVRVRLYKMNWKGPMAVVKRNGRQT